MPADLTGPREDGPCGVFMVCARNVIAHCAPPRGTAGRPQSPVCRRHHGNTLGEAVGRGKDRELVSDNVIK